MDLNKGLRVTLTAARRAVAVLCLAVLSTAPAHGAVFVSSDSLTFTITPRDVWPPAPVTDLVATPGAEGQMLLQWTAPDSNNNVSAPLTPVSGYEIRIATFSVDSVGGSTTAWWNSAMDVRSLPAPMVSASPPTPGQPGVQDSLLLSMLEPGATIYSLIKSTDAAGLGSDADTHAVTPGDQAFALIYDATPPTPTGLAVTLTGSTFDVTWASTTYYDLDYFKIYVDSTTPYDFTDAFVSTAPKSSTSTVIANLGTATYYFRISVVDKGAPGYRGLPLESPPSAAVTSTFTASRLAQTPYGIGLSTVAGTATVSWLPVVRYADGTPFIDANAPVANELSGYRVYRATTPILAIWEEIIDVSTSTLSVSTLSTTTTGVPYYFAVRSENNNTDLSPNSMIRSVGTLDGYSVAPDDRSYFRIPQAMLTPLLGTAGDPASGYAIEVSSRPQDIGGRVYKSLDYKAYRGGTTDDGDFSLNGMGTMYLHYSAYGVEASVSPSNSSVYWWNGMRFVQLYGKPSTLASGMFLETKYFGRYQIRSVERATAFAFNLAGLSNRFVTPNGDGKNDTVVFNFDNPRDAHIRGAILDMRGRVIVANLPPGPVQTSLQWDGTANGRQVPGGIYIYQLEGEGQIFTGTIVILK